MNRYLKAYYDVTKNLASELKEREWSVLAKLSIASEIEGILDWDDFKKIKMTDENQEELVNIIYDIYMDGERDFGVFAHTRATMETLLEYGSYKKFIKNYYKDNAKVYDEIVWKIDY